MVCVLGVAAPTLASDCAPGATARLSIVNHCADAAWAVVTPPGNPQQVAVAGQWDWIKPYVTRENVINTGGTGSIAKDNLRTLTIVVPPNPFPVPGNKLKIIGAVTRGDHSSIVTRVSGNVITLEQPADLPVTGAAIWYYDRQAAFQIAAGARQELCVPDKGAPSGNFRFFMGCPSLAADTDPFNTRGGCLIGAAYGDAAGINTLFEPSFGCVPPLSGAQCAFNASENTDACRTNPSATTCGPLTATDFFDISAVDGYTFPMRIDVQGERCDSPSKDASMLDLASCPTETAATLFSTDAGQQGQIAGGVSLLTQSGDALKSCAAPYKWFGSTQLGSPTNRTLTNALCTPGNCNSASYYAGDGCDNTTCLSNGPCLYCPGGSGPQQKVGPKQNGTLAIQNTNFVQRLRALGYTGYTWQYDDGIGGQACAAGARMTLTLCPSGGRPYQRSQLWRYSASTGTCVTDGTTGTPDGKQTFGSLFDCQSTKMRYTCTDLTASDPFKLPVGIWAADPKATLANTGLTYAEFQRQQQLVCENFTVDVPQSPQFVGGQHLTVPNCTYKTPAGTVCPTRK
jgi:hypothetical protein